MPEAQPSDGERVGLLAKALREEREIQDEAREAIASATRRIRESEQRILAHRRGLAPAPAAPAEPEPAAPEAPAEPEPAAPEAPAESPPDASATEQAPAA